RKDARKLWLKYRRKAGSCRTPCEDLAKRAPGLKPNGPRCKSRPSMASLSWMPKKCKEERPLWPCWAGWLESALEQKARHPNSRPITTGNAGRSSVRFRETGRSDYSGAAVRLLTVSQSRRELLFKCELSNEKIKSHHQEA